MGQQWRQRWVGLGLGSVASGGRKMGWRLGREVRLARSRGRKKEKKKEIEKRRAVVWVGDE